MHGRFRRAFGAVSALWSLVVIGGPVPVHECPVHPGTAAHLAVTRVSPAHGRMAHGGMASEAMAEGHHHAPSHGTRSHNGCCCPGCACSDGGVAWTPSAPVALVAVAATHGEQPRRADARVPAWTRAPHTLPLANAPPLG